jgi:hypothetical protein
MNLLLLFSSNQKSEQQQATTTTYYNNNQASMHPSFQIAFVAWTPNTASSNDDIFSTDWREKDATRQ